MTRLKTKHTAPATREEMEALIGEIADLKIHERALKAEMDGNLKKIKEDYQEDFAPMIERLAVLVPRAQAWAEAHPEAFGKLKSIEMLHGVIGWRSNTPSLKTLAGWTWDRVLERMQAMTYWTMYIRTKAEPNKQGIIADRDTIGPEALRQIGVKVVQEEEFFVEPKLTETEKRATA